MHIYGWEQLPANQNSEKFGGNKHSDILDEKYFIKNMNLINMYFN